LSQTAPSRATRPLTCQHRRTLLVVAVLVVSCTAAPVKNDARALRLDVRMADLEPSFVGGCRAYGLRGSYALHNGDLSQACDQSTPCRLCGLECQESASFPSGMHLPRHNVPQYSGNAVWDSLARDDGFGRAIAALLGDPFAFVITPEVDAFRRVFLEPSLSSNQLTEQLDRAWAADPRFALATLATNERRMFFDEISGFNRSFILRSGMLGQLGESAVKRRIEGALNGKTPLSPEEAMCAAVHMLDATFAQRNYSSVMRELQSRNIHRVPFVIEETDEYGPQSVIWTTPYQHVANGFYGGNMSIKFTSADSGSGLDRGWAHHGCPMVAVNESTFCEHLTNTSWNEMATSDQGETVTPNYKAPDEVLGVNLFEWNSELEWNGTENADPTLNHGNINEDLSLYSRPHLWSFHRLLDEAPAGDGQRPMAYILAPTALGADRADGVFGIEYDETKIRFTASPPPPQFGAVGVGPRVNFTEEHFAASDLPNNTDRIVPVWGMLYPCARTNLRSPYGHEDADTSASHDASVDDVVRCSAARVLRRHRNETEPLYSRLYELELPHNLTTELSQLRVWSVGTTVDLGAKADETSPAGGRHEGQHDVCVLSFAAAIESDASCL